MAGLPSVSVLLVTKNGERYLAELLECVQRQQGGFHLQEIIAVDSGSRDRTLSILRQFGVRIVQIPPETFGHGRTRNLAASHAEADYLVFLTQDATPARTDWLEKLLAPLRADPMIAGGYSRHLPRPDCHPMEWRRIIMEELSGRAQSCLNTRTDPSYAANPAFFYFLSNVSSILRRSIWERFPFPEVEFAEDQLWAKLVLDAGYTTTFRADSLVYHSHGYRPWTNFRRHFDHAIGVRDLDQQPRLTLQAGLRAAWLTTRRDLSFWCWQKRQGRLRIGLRWGGVAFGWHLAALGGTWLGARKSWLARGLVQRLSLQESIKRR